jgi:hypothetical protein
MEIDNNGNRELVVKPARNIQVKSRLAVPTNPTLLQVIAAAKSATPVAINSIVTSVSVASSDVADNLSI